MGSIANSSRQQMHHQYSRKNIITILFCFIAILFLTKGLRLATYSPPSSDNYIWGSFHNHSSLSDGLGSINKVAKEARRSGLGFVLLSDHGTPHPRASLIDQTIEGVKIIGGSEVSIPEGHLIAANIKTFPKYKLPPYPPDAVSDVRKLGGFTVITYPDDPKYQWNYWGKDLQPDGIEIINITSYLRTSSLPVLVDLLLFSWFNPSYFIRSFTYPEHAIDRWDSLLTYGEVSGFYSTNAHGGINIFDHLSVPVPSYLQAFSIVGLGIELKHRNDPVKAIREGDFFSVIRAAGEPERFDFFREKQNIHVAVETIGSTPRIVLKRNGHIISETTTPRLIQPEEPGVYRAEIYLEDHALLPTNVPWILSNPIFIDFETLPTKSEEFNCNNPKLIDLKNLEVEKDSESTAMSTVNTANELELQYHLSQTTTMNTDRWVALSMRRSLDLSSFKGIYIKGTSSEPMRYQFEVRSGATSHFTNFKLTPQLQAVAIPWNRFYRTFGSRETPLLSALDSLFVSVNTAVSITGFSSSMKLLKLGFCY